MTEEKYSLPEGWKWVKLGDVCEKPRYGYTAKANKKKVGPKFLRITDINEDGNVDWGNIPFCECTEKDFEKYQVKAGDIFIARAGSIGRSTLVEEDKEAVFASYLIRMRPKPEPEAHAKYVAYFLKSPEYWKQLFKGSLGTTLKNVNAIALSKIKIPLPPLEEQKRIVTVLETALSRIKKAEEFLKESGKAIEKIMPAAIKKAIPTEDPLPEGWKFVELEEICKFIKDGTHGSPKRTASGIPLLSAKNILEGHIDFTHHSWVDENTYKEIHKYYKIETGDVLLTIVGSIGRTTVVNLKRKFTLLRSVAILRPKSEILSEYLSYSLRTPKAQDQMIKKIKQVAQPGIYLKEVKSITISLPPLSEQKLIVAHLNTVSERVNKLKILHKEASERVERIKASVLFKAFRGDLKAGKVIA